MSSAALPLVPQPAPSRGFAIFANELRFEFVRAMRTRTFSLSVIGFPVMFYVLFGLLMNRGQSIGQVSVAKYMLGGYAVFAVVGAALFGIGVGVAADLSAGWLELKRASPMPPFAYLMAKCCTAMAFGVIIVTILTVLGIAFGHVQITALEYLRMVGLTIVGALPFACMGLLIALTVPFNSAPGIANLIYLPMSFCSGLWIPYRFLPDALKAVAPLLPTFHLAQLQLHSLGSPSEGLTSHHWVNLFVFTAIMLALAAIAFRRREQNA